MIKLEISLEEKEALQQVGEVVYNAERLFRASTEALLSKWKTINLFSHCLPQRAAPATTGRSSLAAYVY